MQSQLEHNNIILTNWNIEISFTTVDACQKKEMWWESKQEKEKSKIDAFFQKHTETWFKICLLQLPRDLYVFHLDVWLAYTFQPVAERGNPV